MLFRSGVFTILAAVGLVVLVALFLFNSKFLTRQSTAAQVPARSVAVLPFLDLTSEAMNEEYFADGMTEELIDRLSKVPDLRVPGACASRTPRYALPRASFAPPMVMSRGPKPTTGPSAINSGSRTTSPAKSPRLCG